MQWDGGDTSARFCITSPADVICDGEHIYIYLIVDRDRLTQTNFEPDGLVEGTSLGWNLVAGIERLTNLKQHI